MSTRKGELAHLDFEAEVRRFVTEQEATNGRGDILQVLWHKFAEIYNRGFEAGRRSR